MIPVVCEGHFYLWCIYFRHCVGGKKYPVYLKMLELPTAWTKFAVFAIRKRNPQVYYFSTKNTGKQREFYFTLSLPSHLPHSPDPTHPLATSFDFKRQQSWNFCDKNSIENSMLFPKVFFQNGLEMSRKEITQGYIWDFEWMISILYSGRKTWGFSLVTR